MPKNVLCEFKSEDVSGHKFEDLDAVLQSLGEAGEEKRKGQVKKKKKAEKGNVDGKKARHSVQKEVSSGKKYPEDRNEDKETEEEGLEMLKDAICSLGLNEGEVESAVKLNQGYIDLEERLDMVEMDPERADELEVLSRQQMGLEAELQSPRTQK